MLGYFGSLCYCCRRLASGEGEYNVRTGTLSVHCVRVCLTYQDAGTQSLPNKLVTDVDVDAERQSVYRRKLKCAYGVFAWSGSCHPKLPVAI